MRLLLVGGVLTAVVCAPVVQAETKADGCDAMVGVWEYVEPSWPGRAIITKQGSKYVGIFFNTLRAADALDVDPSTAAEKVAVGAWEYTCEGAANTARLNLRWLYSSLRPQDVGTESVIEVAFDGNQAKWWFIGPDGKRGVMGAGRRLLK